MPIAKKTHRNKLATTTTTKKPFNATKTSQPKPFKMQHAKSTINQDDDGDYSYLFNDEPVDLSIPGIILKKLEEFLAIVIIQKKRYPTKEGFTSFMGYDSVNRMTSACEKKSMQNTAHLRRGWQIIQDIIQQITLNPDHRNVNGAKFILAATFGLSEKAEYKDIGSLRVVVLPAAVMPGTLIQAPGGITDSRNKSAGVSQGSINRVIEDKHKKLDDSVPQFSGTPGLVGELKNGT